VSLTASAGFRPASAWILPVLLAILVCAILVTPLVNPEQTVLIRVEQALFPFLDLWIAVLAFFLAFKTQNKFWILGGFGSLIIGIADLIFPSFEEISTPMYRYLDIPLFIGYSLWWLFSASLKERNS